LLWQLDRALSDLVVTPVKSLKTLLRKLLTVVEFIRAVALSSCKTVLRHIAQKRRTVSMTEHSRLQSCWWMGIIFSRS